MREPARAVFRAVHPMPEPEPELAPHELSPGTDSLPPEEPDSGPALG